jgi:hypothetical protein
MWTLSNQESACPNGMPTQVTIFGQKFRVRYRKQIYSAPKKTAPVNGMVFFSNRLIVLDAGLTIHDMRETLYHEMCHVYLDAIQKKDGRLVKLSHQQIEGFCDLFGEAIVDLALNNPLPSS